MEFNRNHYFMAGIVLLLLGIQFRMIDSFVLGERATRFLAQRTQQGQVAMRDYMPTAAMTSRKVVKPPQWLGYCLLSLGSVLTLHSLGMKKPGG